jgi:hypothetical protein
MRSTFAVLAAISVVLACDPAATERTAFEPADPAGVTAVLRLDGPWCEGEPRVQLVLTNVSAYPLWLAIDPAEAAQAWLTSESYAHDQGGQGRGRSRCRGDSLPFLRSGRALHLDPGAAHSWQVVLGPFDLRPGMAEVSVNGRLEGAADLDADSTTRFEVEAKIETDLVPRGRCYLPQEAP